MGDVRTGGKGGFTGGRAAGNASGNSYVRRTNISSQLEPAVKKEYFELLVWLPGRGPLRDLVKAESLVDAISLVKFRHKGSRVEVPPPSTKPVLVRSDNYGRPAQIRRRLIRNV